MVWKSLLPLLLAANVEAQSILLLPQPPLDPAATTVLEIDRGETELRRTVRLQSHELNLQIAGAIPWKVRYADPRLWCQELLLAPEIEATMSFPIFAKAQIEGRVRDASGPSAPARVSIQGWAPYSASDPPMLFTIELPVDDGAFSGEVPWATLDLRIAPPGGAPIYLWDVEPDEQGALDLGRLAVTPGSSVSGFLVGSEGRSLAGGSVEIEPLVAAVGAELSQELPRLRRRVEADSGGFFQIAGLEPGRYRLSVTGDGVRGEVPAVEIGPDEELHLPRLLVEPLLSLEVRLVPPAPLDGGRWSVALLAGGEEVRRVQAAASGEAKLDELLAGDYSIVVLAPSGDRLIQEPITLADSQSRELHLDFVEVRGLVTLGDEPIEGRARIQTGRGDSTLFEIDSEGRFAGWIPALERPFLRIGVDAPASGIQRTLELAGEQVDVEQDVIQLAIEFPRTLVHGRLLDEHGRPVPGAMIQAWDSWMPAAMSLTDARGQFTIDGLGQGRWWLTARHGQLGAAAPVRVELSESRPEAELLLTARELRRIDGKVTAHSGLPVRGAQVLVASVGGSFDDFVTTDAVGRFEASVVSGTVAVSVVVMAPSHALWASCLPLFDDHLAIRLPGGDPGVLTIVTTGDLDLPPVEGAVALFSESGGMISGDVRAIWGSAVDATSPGRQVETVAAVSPGWWAVDHVQAPSWMVLAERCSAVASEGIEYENLSSRGELTLEIDLRDEQQRRASM